MPPRAKQSSASGTERTKPVRHEFTLSIIAVGWPIQLLHMTSNPNGTRVKELDLLQEVARVATREALKRYEEPPPEWKEGLVLGTLFDGDWRVFELYVPGEHPRDAIVIASTKVHRHTREVVVTIDRLQLKATAP